MVTPESTHDAAVPGTPSATVTAPDVRERSVGVGSAVGAYLIWGFLPLYFLALAPTGPWELVAWRILLAFVFCVILLTVTRAWAAFGRIVRQPRLLLLTALAGAVIYVNWQVYILGTLGGAVI